MYFLFVVLLSIARGTRDCVKKFRFGNRESGEASDSQKLVARLLAIETGYPGLHPVNGAAVDLLFDESKAKYDAGRERWKALDAKAGTLITIVSTGFGAFAILGDPAKLGSNPWVAAGLIALATAFLVALVAQIPREAQFPDLSHYVSLQMVKNPANAVRIKYELARSWVRDAYANDRACVSKARLLYVSTILLGIGLAALTLNYTLPPAAQKPIPTIRVIVQPSPSPLASP